ncbi:MAG: helix-turn-helix domain-containing protein [Bacteroidia bacterium]
MDKKDYTPLLFYLDSVIAPFFFSSFLIYVYQILTGKSWQTFYFFFFALSIPMALYFFYDIYFAQNDSFNSIYDLINNPPFIYHFFYKGNKVFAILMCYVALGKLKAYNDSIENEYSFIDQMRMNWLKNYILLVMGLYIVSLISFLLFNFKIVSQISSVYIFTNGLISVSFMYLAFHGIRHYSIENVVASQGVSNSLFNDNFISQPTTETKKAEPNGNTDEIYRCLLKLFNESDIYTTQLLKISDVAIILKVPSHQLSKTINIHFGKPFYDFVSYYRINLLKQRLIDPKYSHLTILSIGLDCGFNSKATINRVFKEITGITPSEYQKAHLLKQV